MDKIRIPVRFLQEIIANLASDDPKDTWKFVTSGGNLLICKKIKTKNSFGEQSECIDFQYNPDD